MRKIQTNLEGKKQILFYSRGSDYGWFSNFERSFQIVDNIVYRTNEHYYQSKKANNEEIEVWIRRAPNPFLAMKAGRSLRKKEMIKNWDDIKVEVMLKGLRAKFLNDTKYQSNRLALKLLATGDATLHENSPTDMFWGIKGSDWLGKLLMQVREELRSNENI